MTRWDQSAACFDTDDGERFLATALLRLRLELMFEGPEQTRAEITANGEADSLAIPVVMQQQCSPAMPPPTPSE